jgi:hypothetical protein
MSEHRPEDKAPVLALKRAAPSAEQEGGAKKAKETKTCQVRPVVCLIVTHRAIAWAGWVRPPILPLLIYRSRSRQLCTAVRAAGPAWRVRVAVGRHDTGISLTTPLLWQTLTSSWRMRSAIACAPRYRR